MTMKSENAIWITIISVLVLLVGVAYGYQYGHKAGYRHGVSVQQAYYNDNGVLLPLDLWDYYESRHYTELREPLPEWWRP